MTHNRGYHKNTRTERWEEEEEEVVVGEGEGLQLSDWLTVALLSAVS